MLRLISALVMGAMLLGNVLSALAADRMRTGTPAECETWLKKGVELRRNGLDAEALEAFLRAHAIHPSGRTLAQVGLGRQSLRQWSKAAEGLEQAIESHDPWVEKNRAPIEQALATVKSHLGWLLVSGPPGSHVWLNVIPVGTLPMKERRLEEGYYVVSVQRDGAKAWSDTVEISGGKLSEVAAAVEAAPPVADVVGQRAGLDAAGDAEGSRLGWTIGSGVVGAGLAVAVTGTVVWIQQARGSYGTFDSGATGPALLVGGLVGMLVGSGVIYWSNRSLTVGLNARGPVVGGVF